MIKVGTFIGLAEQGLFTMQASELEMISTVGSYKDVQVAWGSVVTEEVTWETPSPSHMYWGPDKLVVEYELDWIHY